MSAFVIWALVAAGAVFWAYRFWGAATPLPAHAQLVRDGGPARADLTRLLGVGPAAPVEAAEAPPAESARFRLVGVLAPKAIKVGDQTGSGVALIAIDGRPPRAYVVGARVDGELVLTAVSHRSASLGSEPGAPGLLLELPPLAAPATGTLPRAVPGLDASRPPPAPLMMPPATSPGAPGGALRSPVQASPAPGGASSDDEEDEAPPTPPAPTRPRVGGVATR